MDCARRQLLGGSAEQSANSRNTELFNGKSFLHAVFNAVQRAAYSAPQLRSRGAASASARKPCSFAAHKSPTIFRGARKPHVAFHLYFSPVAFACVHKSPFVYTNASPPRAFCVHISPGLLCVHLQVAILCTQIAPPILCTQTAPLAHLAILCTQIAPRFQARNRA